MDTTVAGTAISPRVRGDLAARILPTTERTAVDGSPRRSVREARFLSVSEIERLVQCTKVSA